MPDPDPALLTDPKPPVGINDPRPDVPPPTDPPPATTIPVGYVFYPAAVDTTPPASPAP